MQNPLKPLRKSDRTLVFAGLILALLLVAIFLINPSFMTSLNNKVTDHILVGSEKKPISKSVVIIDLDEKSLEKLGQWPWPRHRLANLLQKASDMGASSIALDILLAEPDRTSPSILQEDAPPAQKYAVDLHNLPERYGDYDKILAETLGRGPFVLGYTFLFYPGNSQEKKLLHPLTFIRVQNKGVSGTGSFFEAAGVVSNLEPFSKAVAYSGFLNATPDQDGIMRRIPLLIQYQGDMYPSLALAALMQSDKLTSVQLRAEKTDSEFLQVGKYSIPIDRKGNVIVHFNAWKEPVPRISAGDILGGLVPPAALRGKIALIGSSASGLDHVYQTPGDPVFSHVDIHASMLETILSGSFPLRNSRNIFWEGVSSLLLALIFSLLIMQTGVLSSGLIACLVIFSLWFGAKMIFSATGYLLSPFPLSLVIVSEYAMLHIMKSRKSQCHAEEATDNALMLLKHSENNLNSIISSIPDIIFRLDSSGKVIFVSPAIAQYKEPAHKFLGRPIFDLVSPAEQEKAAYRLNERRTGNRATRDLELRLLLTKEDSGEKGEERIFRVSAQGLYSEEPQGSKTFLGTQGIARDITEQKKLEGRLLQAQKMEAVGNLAAGVAHDLNNILSGLVSYPELLLLDIPEDSPLRKKVQTIQESGKKAAAIVQDMVTLARRGVANKKVFCPNQVILEYFESPEFGLLKEKHPNIEFQSNLIGDLLNVKGSPLHLSKSLMNIVSNAAEAMPAGGNITVSSSNTYLDTTKLAYEEIPEGEYVLLRVQDNGIGISIEDQGKIFEPFYTKKAMGRSGSGLGMTVIWATVKDQGGYIDLKSKEGEGTSFDIYLPTTRDSVEAQNHRVVLEDYIGKEHVLVVDDIQEQRDIAVNMLSKLGYKVTSVASGEAALMYIKENSIDLLVLDMIMPNGMDGLETYREIIALVPGIKAIIASGFSESDRVKELQRLGAGAYVQKPYTLEKIGVAVRNELDRTFPNHR